ncbi:MAG: hypothetical protein WC895_01040 [Candidatus Shapirobacteria bacterium]|jgi:hypothetical protein
MINLLKIFHPSPIFAQGKEWSQINSKCVVDGVATIKGFECIFYNILQVVVGAAGLAFFAMFIIGGFKYLTSSGDSKKIASASSTLTMAIVGIIGVVASWLILKFISGFTGINVTQFKIGN